jgi:hypothetical protein
MAIVVGDGLEERREVEDGEVGVDVEDECPQQLVLQPLVWQGEDPFGFEIVGVFIGETGQLLDKRRERSFLCRLGDVGDAGDWEPKQVMGNALVVIERSHPMDALDVEATMFVCFWRI